MLYLTFLGKVLFGNIGWKYFCCTGCIEGGRQGRGGLKEIDYKDTKNISGTKS